MMNEWYGYDKSDDETNDNNDIVIVFNGRLV